MRRRTRAVCALLSATLFASVGLRAQGINAGTSIGVDTARTSRIAAVARQVIDAAKFATFVTLDESGRPRSRTVEPQAPDSVFTVWFATNPGTRKVIDIGRDGRVVLIVVRAERREVVCATLGIEGDNGMWLPPSVSLVPSRMSTAPAPPSPKRHP